VWSFTWAYPNNCELTVRHWGWSAKNAQDKNGWSTDAAVLENSRADHPLCRWLLGAPHLSKLKSTYVDCAGPPWWSQKPARSHRHRLNLAVDRHGTALQQPFPTCRTSPMPHAVHRRHPQAFLPPGGPGKADQRPIYFPIKLRILTHLSVRKMCCWSPTPTATTCIAVTARLYSTENRVTGRGSAAWAKTNQLCVIYGMGAQRLRARNRR